MVRISAEDAGKHFAEYLRQAREGQTVIITEGDREVAQLVPCEQPTPKPATPEAFPNLMRLLEKGVRGGGGTFDRDSLYEG